MLAQQTTNRTRVSGTSTEVGMVVFLGQRYGDGLIYLRGSNDRMLLKKAIETGLINEEGYLTPAGFRYWQSKQT